MRSLGLFIAGTTLLTTALAAQPTNRAEPPTNGPDDRRPEMQNPISAGTGKEPFVDVGNVGAKSLAEAEGISIGEATSRLRRMHAAGQGKRALIGTPGFASIGSGEGGVTIYAKAGSQAFTDGVRLVRDADKEFRGRVAVVAVPHSRDELQGAVSLLKRRLDTSPEVYGYELSPYDGRVSILSGDPEATRRTIAPGRTENGVSFDIVKSDPITLSQAQGGAPNNYDATSGGECAMFGFMVVSDDGTKFGITTAGHSDARNARWNGVLPSNPCDGRGTALSYQRKFTGGSDSQDSATFQLGLDVAWYRSSVGVQPKFYDGYYNQWVTGVKWTADGDRVCKYGRVTGRKLCGIVQPKWVYSNGYGYMSLAIAEAGNTPFNLVGDSGGPVWFSSGTAIGFTHAYRNSTELLFMDASALEQRNTGIKVAVCQYAPCYNTYY